MNVGLFAEDDGHRELLVPLIKRVASDEAVDVEVVEHNAAGGAGTVLSSLAQYGRDVRAGVPGFDEILVVAVDGNCHGWTRRRDEIGQSLGQYAGVRVDAVPDPHVELWYLADPRAVSHVLDQDYAAAVPRQKCEPGRYKRALREAFLRGAVDPPQGGVEYGQEIAETMDLDAAEKVPHFGRFVDDLRAALRVVAGSAQAKG